LFSVVLKCLNLGFERENTMKQHDRYMQKADNGQAFKDAIIAAGEAERARKRRSSAGQPRAVAQAGQVPAERRTALLGGPGPAPSRSVDIGEGEKKRRGGSGSLLRM
jgi:hypothetical protein